MKQARFLLRMYYPVTVACIFFLTRFEFVFTFLYGTQLYPPPSPTRSKSYPSNRKTHSGNYKHTSVPTPLRVTTEIVSKAGKNDVREMQLHQHTWPPRCIWELGLRVHIYIITYTMQDILEDLHTN